MMLRLSSLVLLVCLGFQAHWQTYRSVEGGFSVQLPAKPSANEKPLNTNQGVVQRKTVSAQLESTAFSVTWSDYSVRNASVDTKTALQAARDGLVSGAKGKLLEDKEFTMMGFPGLDIRFTARGDSVVRGRLILADSRLYQVLAMAPKDRIDAPEVAKFLSSFKLER